MKAIILFSHGSLLCGAGEALNRHAERLRERNETSLVEVGYLNFSEPLFLDTVRKCSEAGATHILVCPYFLVPGYFVKVDLPKAVDAAKAEFPSLTFTVAEAIGFDERLADALIESAANAREPAEWRNELQNASLLFCKPSPTCPLYATPNCPKVPNPIKTEE